MARHRNSTDALQVVSVSLGARAQRRLHRHAVAAVDSQNGVLVVDDFNDVEAEAAGVPPNASSSQLGSRRRSNQQQPVASSHLESRQIFAAASSSYDRTFQVPNPNSNTVSRMAPARRQRPTRQQRAASSSTEDLRSDGEDISNVSTAGLSHDSDNEISEMPHVSPPARQRYFERSRSPAAVSSRAVPTAQRAQPTTPSPSSIASAETPVTPTTEMMEDVSIPARSSSSTEVHPTLFVEKMRAGFEPRCCNCCPLPFREGDLRLGYATQTSAPRGRTRMQVWWIHAIGCARHLAVFIELGSTHVAFDPFVPSSARFRVLDVLASVARSRTRRHQTLCQWDYTPARLQRWESVPVQIVREQPSNVQRNLEGGELDLDVGEHNLGAEMRQAEIVLGDAVNSIRQAELESRLNTYNELNRMLAMATERLRATGDRLHAAAEENASLQARPAVQQSTISLIPVEQPRVEPQEPCAICREPMRVVDKCRRLPCLHLFHVDCIDPWLRLKGSCPLDKLLLLDMLKQQTAFERPPV